jgi:5-methylcytosine-specific restriction endonuclease McrA
MNFDWAKKIRNRYGIVLNGLSEFPHPQSPAALALMCKDYSHEEHINDNYWVWLAFREQFFMDAGKDGTTCFYCGKTGLDHNADAWDDNLATLDHVVPLAAGGGLYDKNNLVVACSKCNSKKGKLSAEEFIDKLNEQKALEILRNL